MFRQSEVLSSAAIAILHRRLRQCGAAGTETIFTLSCMEEISEGVLNEQLGEGTFKHACISALELYDSSNCAEHTTHHCCRTEPDVGVSLWEDLKTKKVRQVLFKVLRHASMLVLFVCALLLSLICDDAQMDCLHALKQ